jgi:hypothetical protein
MGASTGIFHESEVAVMVTVVLLTTLITPLIMRGAFMLKSQYDDDVEPKNTSEYNSMAKLRAEA